MAIQPVKTSLKGISGAACLPGIATLLVAVTPLATLASTRIAASIAVAAFAYVMAMRHGAWGDLWRGTLRLIRQPAIMLLAGLFGLAIVSSSWSLNPLFAVEHSIRATVTLAALVVIAAAARHDPPDRERMANWSLAGLGLAAIIILILASNYRTLVAELGLTILPSYFNRPAITLCMLLPAAMLANWHCPWRAGALFALTAMASAMTDSETVKFGLLAATAMFVLALWQRRLAGWLFMIGAIFATLLLPLTLGGINALIGPGLQEMLIAAAAQQRLEIWNQFLALIELKPIFGWGFESGRFLIVDGVWQLPGHLRISELHLFHPHNVFLQIWFELGIAGAAMITAATGAAFLYVRRLEGVHHAFAMALLSFVMAVASVSYGAWQYWWIALAGFSAIAMLKAIEASGANNAPNPD